MCVCGFVCTSSVVSTNDEQPTNGFHAYTVLTDAQGHSTLHLNYTLADAGTSPFMANDLLFVQVLGHIRALEPTTGRKLWESSALNATGRCPGRSQRKFGSNDACGLHWQSPIVVNGRVYAVDNVGAVYSWGLPA
jgi:hypothetical protein